MTEATIRRRRADDIAPLAEVLVKVYASDRYPVEGVEDPETWITPNRELASWTALADGQPIGTISIVKADATDPVAVAWKKFTGRHIDQLAIPVRMYVDPEFRRNGTARMLMETMRAFADENQLAIAFDVMLKDQIAIGLYERLGYQRIGLMTHEHSDGAQEPAAIYMAP